MTSARKFALGLIAAAAVITVAAGLWIGEPMLLALGVLVVFLAIPLLLMSRKSG